MVTEKNLKAALTHFGAAFKKAMSDGNSFEAVQLQMATLDGLDDLPLAEQVERLRGAGCQYQRQGANTLTMPWRWLQRDV
jgi:hypothetical protein